MLTDNILQTEPQGLLVKSRDPVKEVQTFTKMSSVASFSVWDYVVFTLMLGDPQQGIGVYYAFSGDEGQSKLPHTFWWGTE